jgi:uncharacterized protein YbaP (TraB family)
MGHRGGVVWVGLALALTWLGARSVASEPEPSAPLLWRIEREPPSYLFGTVHLPDARLLRLAAPVRAAFERADVVHTEVRMDAETQADAARRALLPGSQTLAEVLPGPVLVDLERYLASQHVPVAALSRLRIWAVVTALPLLGWAERMQQHELLDQYLASQARARGARTEALETVASQIDALESMGREAEVELLQATLYQLRDGQRRGVDPMEELLRAYFRGDLAELEAMAFGKFRLTPQRRKQVMEALVYKRNEVMATRIAAALERDPQASQFFAAGALHFSGDRSVVALLRSRGVRVDRVRAGTAPPAATR